MSVTQLTSAQTMSRSGVPACRLATLIVNRDPWTADRRVSRKDHHSNRLFPIQTYTTSALCLGTEVTSFQPSYAWGRASSIWTVFLSDLLRANTNGPSATSVLPPHAAPLNKRLCDCDRNQLRLGRFSPLSATLLVDVEQVSPRCISGSIGCSLVALRQVRQKRMLTGLV